MWRKGNPHAPLVGMQTGAATIQGGMELPQKIKTGIALCSYPATVLLGIFPKKPETLILKNICAPMFTAVLFIIAKIWKQPCVYQ